MNLLKRLSAMVSLGTVLLLAACHTNLYTTPRTVPQGEVSHTVAIELPILIPLPMVRYVVRGGLSERIDLGFAVSTDLKLDLKINPVRSRYVDLAIDPTIGIGAGDGLSAHFGLPIFVGAAVPLILGLNFSPDVIMVLHGGPAVGTRLNGFIETRALTAVVGVGCQIRATEWLAIQPEFSAYFFEPTSPMPRFGLGFAFGPQPAYEP